MQAQFNNIREWLDKRCYSQAELARRANITPSQISKYLQGRSLPRRWVAIRIWLAVDKEVDFRAIVNGKAFCEYIGVTPEE